MPRIVDLRFRKIVRPLKTAFSTALGQKQQMTSIIVTVVLDDGNAGSGEVPTSFAFPKETVAAIARMLSEVRRRLIGRSVGDRERLIEQYRREFGDLRMTLSGLEVALFRAHMAGEVTTEYAFWGAATRCLETDITIPLGDDEPTIERWIGAAAAKGFSTYKLKLGGDRERDERLLSVVNATLQERTPGFRLRLDGNQGYSAAGFLDLLNHIEERGYSVELFEQPLRKDDFRGYEEVMKRRSTPIFLDESVCTAADAARAIDNGLCDGINVKVAKSGLKESRAIIDLARQAGKGLMIGCMIETMVGLSAAIFLAAGTGAFQVIDLDSVHFLYGRNECPGIAVSGPVISVLQKS
jgi:L-Ala-D/L-Glu epimerase